MKLKTLPPSALDSLIQGSKAIYVLNTSALPSGDKGMIVVNFYDGTRREYFKMPPTYIPMSISDAIPKNKLADSRDFKQCLLRGMLTLVDADSAEDFLASEEAQAEYNALVLSEHSSAARNVNVEREVVKRTSISHQSNEAAGPQDVGAVDTVSNKIRGLVESMISGTMTARECLQTLKRHQSALTAVDLSFVAANSSNSELTQWAKATLSQVVAENPTPVALAKTPKAKKSTAHVEPLSKKKMEKEAASFDFGSDDVEMTPEEKAADAKLRAAAMNQQAVTGDSALEREIDALLGGKHNY